MPGASKGRVRTAPPSQQNNSWGNHQGLRSRPLPQPQPQRNQNRHHHLSRMTRGQREVIAAKVRKGIVRVNQELHRKDQLKQLLTGRQGWESISRPLDRRRVVRPKTHDAGIGSAWLTAATVGSKVTR